jgi:hypothetical protein
VTRNDSNEAFAVRMRVRRGATPEPEPESTRRLRKEMPHLFGSGFLPPNDCYVDAAGLPLSREEWVAAHEYERTIAHDLFGDFIEITTSWLGTKEAVFETMVEGDGGATFYREARTWEQAMALHERVVWELKNT